MAANAGVPDRWLSTMAGGILRMPRTATSKINWKTGLVYLRVLVCNSHSNAGAPACFL